LILVYIFQSFFEVTLTNVFRGNPKSERFSFFHLAIVPRIISTVAVILNEGILQIYSTKEAIYML
jgi:hypothetical protein